MKEIQGRNGGKLYLPEPGDRLNPNGRPKGSRNRATIAREWLAAAEEVKNPITGQFEMLSQEDIGTLALVRKMRNGDVNAYRALLDSAYGAPKQEIEQTVFAEKEPSEMDNGELAREVARILNQENDGTGTVDPQ